MSIISNKGQLFEKMIPEVLFHVSASGVTISSERLNTARFVEFDVVGKCRCCKGENIDIDFVVTPRNITLSCNRLKSEKIVLFDKIVEIPQHCLFRIKTRGKNFNIIHNEPQKKVTQFFNNENIIHEFLEFPPEKKARIEKETGVNQEIINSLEKKEEKLENKEKENVREQEKKNEEQLNIFDGDELGQNTFLHNIPL